MKGRPPIKADKLTGIGAEIRRRRMAAGKTIRELAILIAVPESTWRGWEKGDMESAARLKIVADALDCTADDLLPE